jgi:uncharacterized protein (TIGR02246 family)
MDISGEVPSQDDVDAIVKLVDIVADAQSREDADTFLTLFRPDAKWVTGHGKRLYGLPVIAEFTRAVLPGATKDSYSTYAIDHILFIRPDIAAVTVNQTYIQRDGSQPDTHGSPGWTLLKEDGEWRIAAAQNTIILT